MKKKRKACLISGGGAWGAYGGGTLERINKNYDVVVGVSTGSLLAPLTALREWEVLKQGYTGVGTYDIFDKCWYKGKPITKSGKIRKLPIIMTLLKGQKSIYTSTALRKTIDRFFPEYYFEELRKQKKDVLVGTQNYAQHPSKIHYFSSSSESYTDFKDWMWSSACFPFFTTLHQKSWRDGKGGFHIGQWSDGGLTDLVGIEQLKGKEFKEIDIILHRTKVEDRFEGDKVNSLMENVTTAINGMRYDIEFEYFNERITELTDEGAKVNVYWLPRKPSPNSMVFNQKEMKAWWEEGYQTAFDPDRLDVHEPSNKRF